MGNCFESNLVGAVGALYREISSSGVKHLKLLMLGFDGSGKTTLLYMLKLGEVVTIPTIGFNVEEIEIKGRIFTLWEIGGQEQLRPIWKCYFDDIDGLIFVFDSSDDYKRIEEAWNYMKKLYISENVQIPTMILLNKCDLEKRITSSQFLERFHPYDLFHNLKNNWFIEECSGQKYEGVEEALELLADTIILGTPPQKRDYHIKHFSTIKKIHKMIGWRPEIHVLFPKDYRKFVWSLILIRDRLSESLSVDSMKIILSYIPVNFGDLTEMKKISDKFEMNLFVYQNYFFMKQVI